ncbi:hypothetical protein [Streptomyces werraensis]|uniref:hypothetical protein n=1 Tax=Streptomyces werraensis TaxID=68284 RepID=UPI0037D5B534
MTVSGNGSAALPYVVSAGGASTAVEAADTPTVDTTVTGTGAADDPYVVSASVILDPAPPGGGDNLLHEGPDGLYVECADVRGCLSAGDGIAYDEATGEIAARPSTDAGNTLSFGTDGGLLVPPAAAPPTGLQGSDTPTVDITVTGTGAPGDPYDVSAAVILDPAPPGGGDNLLQSGPDGLFLECEQVRGCLVAGTGITYDPDTGEIAATGSAAEPLATEDSTCIAFTGDGTAGTPLTATPIVDPAPGNALTCGPDGLMVTPGAVSCDDVRPCLSAGDGIAYDTATGEISARPSTDVGNTLGFGTDGGLLVPGPEALETACGLTGDGTAGAPLAAAVGAWGYPCDLDASAGQVYCDSTGQLRGEPRSLATFVQDQQILNPANLTVPAAQDTVVASHTLVIANPDLCRAAFVMVEGEADADFNLPPNSGAALGITTDEMSYVANNGPTTLLDVHTQGTKVVHTTIPPGGSINFTITITMGRGSGGATYNRIQSYLRAFVFVL